MRLEFFKQDNTFVDSRVEAERLRDVKVRQVVAILLLSPDGKRVCLTIPKAAVADQRLNPTPPQGEVERYESISAAARRELWEELKVEVDDPIFYINNVLRQLSEDHPRRKEFEFYRYHWVAVHAKGYKLQPEESIDSAAWHYLDAVGYQSECMSAAKKEMFKAALSALQKKARDKFLIRREILQRTHTDLLVA